MSGLTNFNVKNLHNDDCFRIFAAFKLKDMKKELLNNYEAFRLWFNRMFSLSLNGKFKGIGNLKDWKRFAYRLYKELNGYYLRPSSDVLVMRVSGQTIKLYSR